MTIKPNRFDLVAGLVFASLLVVGISWILDLFALALVREPSLKWAIAALVAVFAGCSFVLTHLANLCLFRVRLSDDGVQIRGVLRDRRIRGEDIDAIFFAENVKYAHIILSTGSGSAVMSSLLWSRKAFHELMADVTTWAERLGRPAPVVVDTVSPGSDATAKQAARKLRAGFVRDWLFYALILAGLALGWALILAAFHVATPMSRNADVSAAPGKVGGVTRMRCRVTAEGKLSDCVVVFECPAGRGFGAAALKAAAYFKMRPRTADGRPVGGGEVVIPIKWKFGGAEIPAKCLSPTATR